ncbi:Cof-like hydrolase [Clostridiales bacterium oral taxon 876 str. F0540]|nr:Cof-like hydrolase [Clostridiales bacterium oral taxon 876 str. F0540]
MGKKAVFFDVDGTLIDCAGGMECVLNSTEEAIEKIKKNGHLTVLATGRPKSFLDKEITRLGFDAYITSNGAYIEMKGKEIYNRKIDTSTLKEVISLCKAENMDYIFEGQNFSYVSDFNSNNIKNLLNSFSISPDYLTDINDPNKISANKMVLIFDDAKQKEISINLLGDRFSFMNHPGLTSYDVYFKDCTKADGIKRLSSHLKISIEDTVAFGDGINDIEMLQTVKYGIAMGNAHEKLKKVAYFVTNDVFSHGIYNALTRLQII